MKNNLINLLSVILLFIMLDMYVPTYVSYASTDELKTVGPILVTPKYESNDTIVADYIIKPATDSSTDMYSIIQNTLNECHAQGGGTVFLEEGIYYISKSITVPELCTLRGDYQDPDKVTDASTLNYGTIIVTDVYDVYKNKYGPDNYLENSTCDLSNDAQGIFGDFPDMEKTGLFNLSNSSGVVGLTIYYKNQNINAPIVQPWTFYYGNRRLMTIKNVTLINSYLGIGRSTADGGSQSDQVHEMLMIENVKGTVLKKGVLLHNSSDVGTVAGLSLEPKYWADANLSALGESGTKPTIDAIMSKTRSLYGLGLVLTDIEQQQIANVTIKGYKNGVYIPKDDEDQSAVNVQIRRRAMGSGLIYNLKVSNCEFGLKAEDGYELDWRCGYYISNSSIEGSMYAIYNNSKDFMGRQGTLQLNDVELKGRVGGNAPIIYYSKEAGCYVSVYDKVGNGRKCNRDN